MNRGARSREGKLTAAVGNSIDQPPDLCPSTRKSPRRFIEFESNRDHFEPAEDRSLFVAICDELVRIPRRGAPISPQGLDEQDAGREAARMDFDCR